jgi:hypothetical protein
MKDKIKWFQGRADGGFNNQKPGMIRWIMAERWKQRGNILVYK